MIRVWKQYHTRTRFTTRCKEEAGERETDASRTVLFQKSCSLFDSAALSQSGEGRVANGTREQGKDLPWQGQVVLRIARMQEVVG